MTGLIQKLKTMLTGNSKTSKVPATVKPEDYAIIKLKKFDDLSVVIMADKVNGGLSVTYEDKHLPPETQEAVKREIQEIISQQFEEVTNADI